jgi:hypothetical protein
LQIRTAHDFFEDTGKQLAAMFVSDLRSEQGPE